METGDGAWPDDLSHFRGLIAEPARYHLFHALRVLEAAYRDAPRLGESRRAAQDRVRLRQVPELAFPASTITDFRPAEGDAPAQLTNQFFGLFGPHGPLPLHLTEYARDRLRNQRDPTLVAFADMLTHRLMGLLYRAWAAGQPAPAFDRAWDDLASADEPAAAEPDLLEGLFPQEATGSGLARAGTAGEMQVGAHDYRPDQGETSTGARGAVAAGRSGAGADAITQAGVPAGSGGAAPFTAAAPRNAASTDPWASAVSGGGYAGTAGTAEGAGVLPDAASGPREDIPDRRDGPATSGAAAAGTGPAGGRPPATGGSPKSAVSGVWAAAATGALPRTTVVPFPRTPAAGGGVAAGAARAPAAATGGLPPAAAGSTAATGIARPRRPGRLNFGGDSVQRKIAALAGYAPVAMDHADAMPDLSKRHFAGHLSAGPKHAEGLRSILSAFFEAPVEIRQFIGHWLALEPSDTWQLGGSGLGRGTSIGSRVWSRDSKFRIRVGPLGLKAYQRMMPGRGAIERMEAIVRNYVGDRLAWDVQLVLKAEEVPRVALGGRAGLGYNTWAGRRRDIARDADDLILTPPSQTAAARALAGH